MSRDPYSPSRLSSIRSYRMCDLSLLYLLLIQVARINKGYYCGLCFSGRYRFDCTFSGVG